MMRLSLICVGKLKDAQEQAVVARYEKRIAGIGGTLGFSKLETHEIAESRGQTAELRRQKEAQNIMQASAKAHFKLVLDEGGATMTSIKFAQWLGARRDDGISSIAVLIGGPDGHNESIRQSADFTLALSNLTLPHGLARIVFIEQLYRAMTILSGHPYHRD